VHVHLAMIAKLTFALKSGEFREAVKRRAPEGEIVRIAIGAEDGL
jgi:hypothetical protein